MAEDDLELAELDVDDLNAKAAAEMEAGLEDEGDSQAPPVNAKELEAVYDIPVQVSAVLGKSTMKVSQLLKLGRGAVVELDRKVGEAIDTRSALLLQLDEGQLTAGGVPGEDCARDVRRSRSVEERAIEPE